MFKRLLSIIMTTVIICLITVFSANAESANRKYTPAMSFLNEYLHDLKNGDIDKALNHTDDTRFNLNAHIDPYKLNSKELSYVSFAEEGGIFKSDYAEESIIDYEILEEASDGIVTARIHFSNGHDAIIPFNLIQDGTDYIVKITPNDISMTGYRSIKSADLTIEQSRNNSLKASGTLKDSYEFSYLYGTIYGIDSFSVSKNGVRIDGYQANDAIDTGWTKKAEVIYSIVERHWYGDYVWASTNNSIVKNGSFSVSLVGKNSSQSNLRIRISNQTQANPRSKGNGKIYSISI